MQHFGVVGRFMQQPRMIMLGAPTGAGAAKSGQGAWAAGGIVIVVAVCFGAVVSFMATRSLSAWVARMRRRDALAWARRQSQR
jgi:hypothetical protein